MIMEALIGINRIYFVFYINTFAHSLTHTHTTDRRGKKWKFKSIVHVTD
jgi:hypothetical protein